MSIKPLVLDDGGHYFCVAFSPDGSFLAIASAGAAEGVSRVLWHRDGSRTVSTTAIPGKMIVWNTNDWTVQAQWTDDLVQTVVWHPEGRIIASTSLKGVTLWEATTGKLLRRFFESEPVDEERRYCGEYSGLEFSLEGRILAVCKNNWPDERVLLVDHETGRIFHDLTKNDDGAQAKTVKFLPDDSRVIGLGEDDGNLDGTIFIEKAYVWDRRHGRLLATFDFRDHMNDMRDEHGSSHVRLFLSPTGRYLATNGTAQVWELVDDPTTGWRLRQTCSDARHIVRNAMFSANERLLMTTCVELSSYDDEEIHAVRLWEIVSGKEHAVYRIFGECFCAAISPDSRTLATISTDMYGDSVVNTDSDDNVHEGPFYTLTLWDVASKQDSDWQGATGRDTKWEYYRPMPKWPYSILSFSPDSRWLAVKHTTHVEIWDVEQIRTSSVSGSHKPGDR